MYFLVNTRTNALLACVDHIPAFAMNRFVRDFPWLIVERIVLTYPGLPVLA